MLLAAGFAAGRQRLRYSCYRLLIMSYQDKTDIYLKITHEQHSLGTWCAQSVKVLRYTLKGRGFDSRWDHRNFSLTQSFRPHYSPAVDSASNRHRYQEYVFGG